MSLDDVAGILGAVAVVLTAVTGLLGYRWGRGNTRAEETLTRATARKVQAEAEAAEANASIDTIAGNIDRRFDELVRAHHDLGGTHRRPVLSRGLTRIVRMSAVRLATT